MGNRCIGAVSPGNNSGWGMVAGNGAANTTAMVRIEKMTVIRWKAFSPALPNIS